MRGKPSTELEPKVSGTVVKIVLYYVRLNHFDSELPARLIIRLEGINDPSIELQP